MNRPQRLLRRIVTPAVALACCAVLQTGRAQVPAPSPSPSASSARVATPASAATDTDAHARPPSASTPASVLHFDFHSAFLVNLHHVLYDAARHPERPPSFAAGAGSGAQDQATWRAAVAFYRENYAQRDLLFDPGMRDILQALAAAGDARQDTAGLGLPPPLAEQLARAAPVYARTLWPAQDAANRAWIARAQALETRYGAAIQPALERIFAQRFPASIRDDIVVETGMPNGAYTSERPPQTVLPSGRAGYDGFAALEMIWHEAAHAQVTDTLSATIDAQVAALHRDPARAATLWHAAQFYAVGFVVQDVLARQAQIEYVPYARKNDVYAHGWAAYVPMLETDWQAWLQGRGTLEEAAKAMVTRLPPA